MLSDLKEYLEAHKIKYKEHKHPAVFTVEQSKKIKLTYTGMHTKSLFLKDNKGNFYLISMNANKKLDTKILKKYLNIKKLHFASPEELKSKLNVTPGSVSIFSIINDKNNEINLFLDK